MTREFLKNLGITEKETIDEIMKEHGTSIEKAKTIQAIFKRNWQNTQGV